MFSIQVKTIFRVLGEAFLKLSDMSETETQIGSASRLYDPRQHTIDRNSAAAFADQIATDDRPDTGAQQTEYPLTNTPAAVFDAGNVTAATGTSPPPSDPASVFTQAAPPAAPSNTDAPANAMVDTDGLRWDDRIHSSARTMNGDGRWKKRKNVDPAIVKQVESEMRGPVAEFVPLNAPPPPAAPAGGPVPTTFVELCRYVNERKLPAAKTLEALGMCGIEGGMGTLARPEYQGMIAAVHSVMETL